MSARDKAIEEKQDETARGYTRREIGKLGLGLAAAVGGLSLGARAARAEDKLVTDMPEHATLVTGLQYVNESPYPDKQCKGCVLFTAVDDTKGKCTLFPTGLVSATGHCASWAAKPA